MVMLPMLSAPPLWFVALCLFSLLLILPEVKGRVLFGLAGTAFFYAFYDWTSLYGWFILPW